MLPLETILSLDIFPTAEISPVFLKYFVFKSALVKIFPSFCKLLVVKLFATIIPDETAFLLDKSPLVEIFPKFKISFFTVILSTEVKLPELFNFPSIPVLLETWMLPLFSKFLTFKFPPVLTAAKTFLKSSALKFPATLISPVFKRLPVLKFPSEYILELFWVFPFKLISPAACVSPFSLIFLALILIPLSELASSLWAYSVPLISIPFPLILATFIFPSAVISSFLSLE